MQHKRHWWQRIKGSSITMIAMYVLWIWFICVQVYTYANYHTFLPSEMTYATAACFIVETVSLARLRMAREGCVVKPRRSNQFLQKLGIANDSELEEITQEISEKNKEANDEH